jgi:catechol 2,3-dioxygenase-like lactoylglutathione lyase family enzyme
MIQVRRLGHATFSTQNMNREVEYWQHIMGFVVTEQTKDRVILSTKYGHEAIALVKGEPGWLQRLSFQVAPGSDLDELARNLQGHGVKCDMASDITPGIRKALTFTDPKGTLTEIYAEYALQDDDKRDPVIAPLKFGHIAYRVNDPKKITDFYIDVLGFRMSDWIGDHFSFLRCGPDHHTVNFARYKEERLHHIAFEMKDSPTINRACDYLAKNKIQLVWGPIRHIVGHNLAAYHRNHDDIRVEMFCELDLMLDETLGYFEPRPWHEDRPQRPKVWPGDTWRAQWGFGSFGTFPGYP